MSYLPLVEREKKAKERTMDWLDNRLDTLIGDRNLIAETSGYQAQVIDTWIDDLREAGRKLSISPMTCQKYHGKWNSKSKICTKSLH